MSVDHVDQGTDHHLSVCMYTYSLGFHDLCFQDPAQASSNVVDSGWRDVHIFRSVLSEEKGANEDTSIPVKGNHKHLL